MRGPAKSITFTQLEMDYLRIQAENRRARLYELKVYPHRVYEENRYEFVREYMRGANPASSPKEQAWLKKIKDEILKVSRSTDPA